MRKILLGALTALMFTAANAAENTDSTSCMLPGCKLAKKEITAGTKNYVAWVRCLQTIHTVRVILDLLEQQAAVGRVSLDPLGAHPYLGAHPISRLAGRYFDFLDANQVRGPQPTHSRGVRSEVGIKLADAHDERSRLIEGFSRCRHPLCGATT